MFVFFRFSDNAVVARIPSSDVGPFAYLGRPAQAVTAHTSTLRGLESRVEVESAAESARPRSRRRICGVKVMLKAWVQ